MDKKNVQLFEQTNANVIEIRCDKIIDNCRYVNDK